MPFIRVRKREVTEFSRDITKSGKYSSREQQMQAYKEFLRRKPNKS